MNEKYNWDLKDIFKNKSELLETQNQLNIILDKIKQYQGTLNTSKNIYECYSLYEKALEIYEKVYAYGMLKFHLDMADSENIKLYKKVEDIGTEFEKSTSFITPEITNLEENEILKFIEENSNLKRYERLLKEIIEEKKHILSKEEEGIIANYSQIFSSITNIWFKFIFIIN